MKLISTKLDHTYKVAKIIAKKIKLAKKSRYAIVVGLFGDLGAGKTTITQNFGNLVGVKNIINSPTFVILKRYKLDWEGFKKLIHIDAYRLNSGKELIELGFNDILKERNSIIFIEWPERIKDILPYQTITIKIQHVSKNKRIINVN